MIPHTVFKTQIGVYEKCKSSTCNFAHCTNKLFRGPRCDGEGFDCVHALLNGFRPFRSLSLKRKKSDPFQPEIFRVYRIASRIRVF